MLPKLYHDAGYKQFILSEKILCRAASKRLFFVVRAFASMIGKRRATDNRAGYDFVHNTVSLAVEENSHLLEKGPYLAREDSRVKLE